MATRAMEMRKGRNEGRFHEKKEQKKLCECGVY